MNHPRDWEDLNQRKKKMANSSQLSETISDSPFIIFQPFDSIKINKKSYKFFLNVNAKILSKTVCFFLVS